MDRGVEIYNMLNSTTINCGKGEIECAVQKVDDVDPCSDVAVSCKRIEDTVAHNQDEEENVSHTNCNHAQESNVNLSSNLANHDGTCPAGLLDNNSKLSSVSLNRKKKPPHLHIHPAIERKSSESPKDHDSQSPVKFVTLKSRIIKSLDAGLNSPIVKRASRLERILEIPDVAAALVRDEGYDILLRKRTHNHASNIFKSCSERQQTPSNGSEREQFVFDDNLSEITSDHDAESVSIESKSPSTPLSQSSQLDNATEVTDLLQQISNCTTPSSLFKDYVDRTASPLSSPALKKRKSKKVKSPEVEDSNEVSTPTKKTLAFFSRFRLTSVSRSSSVSSLEGWDSLSRALARVGALSPASAGLKSFEVEPKLTPILKRRSPAQLLDGKEHLSPQDPGTKTPLRKKTVSFSRLPSEALVTDAADCISLMQGGNQFVKMRSNSRVYNRLYWLDESMDYLRWEPTKKDPVKARIELKRIREVRPGKTTELFLNSSISTHFPDECSFSIVQSNGKTLDLIANSPEEANVWITGLRCLMSDQDIDGLRMRSEARDTWLSSMFDEADLNKDGYLDQEESLKLLMSLSDGIRELRIKQKLKEHFQLTEGDKSDLSRDDFVDIFKDIATRPEVYFLLARYATKNDQLSVDDLKVFLDTEQGVCDVTNEHCLQLIEEYEPFEATKALPALGIDGFTKYLMSDNCSIFDPKHLKVCQDMTQPLSHYFIASSHNTYLMEDQVNGPCNVNAYIRALLRCCRCVELDCWDGEDGAPIVTHGHTPHLQPQKWILFEEVIGAIKSYAFRNSSYPVILSIENHCTEIQQMSMAHCLKKLLGNEIYAEDINDLSNLPSPESLRNRFLIRGKKLPKNCVVDVGLVSGEDEGIEVDKIPIYPVHGPVHPDTERRRPLVRELSDLVSICEVVCLKENFLVHQQSYSFNHTSSISEDNATALVSEEFINHNKKFLTRVYPNASRVDSSNFNPQEIWNSGVQIAALNYQTPGLMMDINDGKFSMNGGCGYVLKPNIMRDPLAYYSASRRDSLPGEATKNLHIRIISGQNFPKPRGGGARGQVIDPYVLIEIFGIPVDCSEQRTRTAPNNSCGSPVFDESFEFRLLLPSLSLVRFVVLDDDFIGDEFIGQYTIPFDCLLPGYRHLRLRSIFDEPLDNATLFVHIAIAEADICPNVSGASTPSQTGTTVGRFPGKRANAQKRLRKLRVRKDADFLQMRDIGQSAIEDIFRGASEHLLLAATLRDSLRLSLACFREACGVNPMSSVKQCVRAMSQRSLVDSSTAEPRVHQKRKSSSTADSEGGLDSEETVEPETRTRTSSGEGNKTRLRRQQSDTSHSSTDSGPTMPGQAFIIRQERKIVLVLKGQCATSESWRKMSLAMDDVVTDSLAIQDKAVSCCEMLTSIYDKVEKLYADLPKLLSNESPVSDSHESNGTTPAKKKVSKKKQLMAFDLERRKRYLSEENFRWNCSVIKGQRNMCKTSLDEANTVLSDVWNVGNQVGLVGSMEQAQVNGHVSSNENGNSNAVTVTSRMNGTKVDTGTRKHALPQRAR